MSASRRPEGIPAEGLDLRTPAPRAVDEAAKVDALADWLGEQPESRNVFDYTDEATTVITIGVEELARRMAEAGLLRDGETRTEFQRRVEAVLAERERFEGSVLVGPHGDGFCAGWASAIADVRSTLSTEVQP